jgi:hypothetical protein
MPKLSLLTVFLFRSGFEIRPFSPFTDMSRPGDLQAQLTIGSGPGNPLDAKSPCCQDYDPCLPPSFATI